MSSTNRGRERNAKDYYVTPVEDIKLFLTAFAQAEPGVLNQHDIRVLDPCAGGDFYRKMSYPTALAHFNIPEETILTMDIREDSRAMWKINYLHAAPFSRSPDIIITNPPFDLALPIIKKASSEVVLGGFVIMLLRLNFFGSQIRFPFWQENLPKYCFVHHQRMSFTDDGGMDSIEYAHMVWEKGLKVAFTKLKVI